MSSNKLLLTCLISLATASLPAAILLDQTMSKTERDATGIYKLTPGEKAALESWLNENFIEKPSQEKSFSETTLTVVNNSNNGQQITLSDGSVYEIAPDDWDTTSLWVLPVEIRVTQGVDPYYPFTLTNVQTGNSAKANLIAKPSPRAPTTPPAQTPAPTP